MQTNVIYNEECIQGMSKLPDKSIDMILCDLPYGTTANKWDTVIPFDKLWKQYERLIKDKGAIVLTANASFTNKLINSNLILFKYKWIWIKNNTTNFMNAKNRPLSKYEEILIFSKSSTAPGGKSMMNYYPQGLIKFNKSQKNNDSKYGNGVHTWNGPDEFIQEFTNYPNDILRFNAEKDTFHPTQKPVALFEYLIKTYTQNGGVVLDNCMGSGTTAIACINTERQYIGFETDKEYYDKSIERIKKHNHTQLDLFESLG